MAPKAKSMPGDKAAPKSDKPKAAPKKDAKPREPRPEDMIERVDKPDRTDFEARISAVSDAVTKLQEEKKEIDVKIKAESSGKDEFFAQKEALHKEIALYVDQLERLKGKKEELAQQIDTRIKDGKANKDAYQKMKNSMPYSDEDAIDKRLAEIEFQMHTQHRTIAAEKKMMQEIQELKRMRPKVATLKSLDQKRNQPAGDFEDIKKSKGELVEMMNEIFAKKQEASLKLKELSASRSTATGALIEQRDGINKQIGEKIAERNNIRSELKKAEDEYWEYQKKIRDIKQKRAEDERNLKAKENELRERRKKAEALEEQPYVYEIGLIQQTIAFCKSLTTTKAVKEEEEKKEIKHINADNEVVLCAKKDRDEEYFYAPTAKGKKNKNKNKGEATETAAGKPIKHNAATFQLFEKLKLEAPITVDDVPPVQEKLEALLVDYNNKVAEWEEKKEELKRKIMSGEDEEAVEVDGADAE